VKFLDLLSKHLKTPCLSHLLKHYQIIFLHDGDRVFHTYSTYGRGMDMVLTTYHYLDLTPFGRGEGWDGMPDLDQTGMFWTKHHDKYVEEKTARG
jgi:predicted dithiol-disulfide oxidoreductase (DUF899 family)